MGLVNVGELLLMLYIDMLRVKLVNSVCLLGLLLEVWMIRVCCVVVL